MIEFTDSARLAPRKDVYYGIMLMCACTASYVHDAHMQQVYYTC
jgi:hypothetical protein